MNIRQFDSHSKLNKLKTNFDSKITRNKIKKKFSEFFQFFFDFLKFFEVFLKNFIRISSTSHQKLSNRFFSTLGHLKKFF